MDRREGAAATAPTASVEAEVGWGREPLLLPPWVEGSPTALGEEAEVGRGEGATAPDSGRGGGSSRGTVYGWP